MLPIELRTALAAQSLAPTNASRPGVGGRERSDFGEKADLKAAIGQVPKTSVKQ